MVVAVDVPFQRSFWSDERRSSVSTHTDDDTVHIIAQSDSELKLKLAVEYLYRKIFLEPVSSAEEAKTENVSLTLLTSGEPLASLLYAPSTGNSESSLRAPDASLPASSSLPGAGE